MKERIEAELARICGGSSENPFGVQVSSKVARIYDDQDDIELPVSEALSALEPIADGAGYDAVWQALSEKENGPIFEGMRSFGFEPAETGSGCTAFSKQIPEEGIVFALTKADNMTRLPDSYGDPVYIEINPCEGGDPLAILKDFFLLDFLKAQERVSYGQLARELKQSKFVGHPNLFPDIEIRTDSGRSVGIWDGHSVDELREELVFLVDEGFTLGTESINMYQLPRGDLIPEELEMRTDYPIWACDSQGMCLVQEDAGGTESAADIIDYYKDK